jgi:hypothetical protein
MKNTTGKRRGLLPILFGVFVITTFIIGCSGKKTGQSAEEKTEPRQKNEEIASKPNSGEIDNTASDGDLIQDVFTQFLSEVQTYDRDNFGKSDNLGIGIYGSGDYEDNIFVYYTVKDKKIKIIESFNGQLMYSIMMTCYFINENDCRIEFSLSGFDQFMEENGYEEENGNIYYMIDGVLYRDINGTRVRQNDEHGVLNRINHIKNEFNARYS